MSASPLQGTLISCSPITADQDFVKVTWARTNGLQKNGPSTMAIMGSPRLLCSGKDSKHRGRTGLKRPKARQRRQGEREMVPSHEDAQKNRQADGQDVGQISMIRTVQKAVNGVRRVAGKLRKTEEEKVNIKKAWQSFQEQLEKDFITQRSQFHQDMEKFEMEEAALQEAPELAMPQLRVAIRAKSLMEVEPIKPAPKRTKWLGRSCCRMSSRK